MGSDLLCLKEHRSDPFPHALLAKYIDLLIKYLYENLSLYSNENLCKYHYESTLMFVIPSLLSEHD